VIVSDRKPICEIKIDFLKSQKLKIPFRHTTDIYMPALARSLWKCKQKSLQGKIRLKRKLYGPFHHTLSI
jgi:hypothetical protein